MKTLAVFLVAFSGSLLPTANSEKLYCKRDDMACNEMTGKCFMTRNCRTMTYVPPSGGGAPSPPPPPASSAYSNLFERRSGYSSGSSAQSSYSLRGAAPPRPVAPSAPASSGRSTQPDWVMHNKVEKSRRSSLAELAKQGLHVIPTLDELRMAQSAGLMRAGDLGGGVESSTNPKKLGYAQKRAQLGTVNERVAAANAMNQSPSRYGY